MTEWYLWEKTPGRLGILPISRKYEHAAAYVAEFSGELSEAIRFAENLERTGYSVVYDTGFMPPPEPPEADPQPTEQLKTYDSPAVTAPEEPVSETHNDVISAGNIVITDDPEPDPATESFMLPLEDYTEDPSKQKKNRTAKSRAEKKTIVKEEIRGQLSIFDLEF